MESCCYQHLRLGTTVYTFTPTAGQCAAPVSLNITIVNKLCQPSQHVPNSVCQNAAAPALPTTSKEGITGTWSPASINTSALGTTTYTFTPSAGNCATPASIKHYNCWQHLTNFSNISQFLLPEYHGAAATDNIEGRNNRNMESGQYQYICPWNCDLHIYTIRGQLCDSGFFKRYHRWQHLTNFHAIPDPLCQNSTAPVLPPTSKEGITGTWSPASINTSALGTATYTFTPSSAAIAHAPASLNVTIVGSISPTFPTIADSYCQNTTAPALPPTSKEGITGTWSPASINTSALGTATYTFTPSAGNCATPVSLNITIVGNISPTFPTIANSYCQNTTAPALPTTSKEGITGTWSPASINTSALGTATYTFTPSSAGNCATPVSLNITIVGNISPTFPTLAIHIARIPRRRRCHQHRRKE